jgi:hypothetical protein
MKMMMTVMVCTIMINIYVDSFSTIEHTHVAEFIDHVQELKRG